MIPNKTSSVYKTVANRAKVFIERHWRDDLTLQQIAAHVFMSPFHFQRIFKKETGESPKDYLTRLRIDGAAVTLRVDQEKSMYEVAADCGFSFQSVFARAFRHRFRMSPTVFRRLSLSEITKLAVWDKSLQRLVLKELYKLLSPAERKKILASIKVKHIELTRVIYSLTTMKSEEHIVGEFHALAHRAAAYDLPIVHGECYGVMNDFPLHTPQKKCRYKVCLSIPPSADVPSNFFSMEIGGGKFVVFPVRGNIEKMIERVIFFFNEWLYKSSYKMADYFWFERFTDLPSLKTYSRAEREFYIPIKPL